MAFVLVILLINVIWLVTISGVSCARLDTSLNLPASEAQILDLAQNVCSDLYSPASGEAAVKKCIEDFNDPDKALQVSRAGFRVRCHADKMVTFHISPSKHTRLIVVLPDPLDVTQRLRYRIMKPGTKLNDLETTPDELTIFTSTIENGRHSLWLKESKIRKWEALSHKEYDIQMQFPKITANDTVEGIFTWNQTGEADSCFNFISWCDNSGYVMDTRIQPDTRPLVVVPLPKGDSCKARVIGAYGTTTLSFDTPASDLHNDEEDVKKTSPTDVSVHAEPMSGAWFVSVNWSQPELTPDYYNVTLFAEPAVSQFQPGNATNATFSNVSLNEYYHVAISSVLGQFVAHTSRKAMLYGNPGKSSDSHLDEWRWASAAGGAWGVVAAVGAVILALRRYNARKLVPVKLLPPVAEVEPLEESIPETVPEKPRSDEWEISSEMLLLHEIIGDGAFGVVRRGTLAPDWTNVAVKMLKKYPTLEERRAFYLEMELMKSVGSHGHVVSLVGCCSGSTPLIVAEYCSRGDLLHLLRRSWDALMFKRSVKYLNNNVDSGDYRNDLFLKCKPRDPSKFCVNRLYEFQNTEDNSIYLTPLDLLSFCRQIAMGMEFLAANKLVHRDLAARNILVTHDNTLKIADFGLSRDVYEENQYRQQSNGKMPVKWMALESLTRKVFTTQSDVWSFGVVVWEIVTVGATPYPDVPAARLTRLLRAGYRMSRPRNCSKPLYELMEACWEECPQARPSFAELHAALDRLMDAACADTYLALDLHDAPHTLQRRYHNILRRAKRYFTKAESYERPLLEPRGNIYTSPPESTKTTLSTISTSS